MISHIDTSLVNICLAQGQTLTGLTHNSDRVSGGRLLLTIAGLESTFGQRRMFVRYEPGYGPGGTYYKGSQTVRQRWYTYGCLAASSYGSFQLMYITADELGFLGHPIDLQKDETCAFWAAKLIRDRIIGHQKAKTMTDVLDAYNSGNAIDRNVPADYIAKGIQLYTNLDNV